MITRELVAEKINNYLTHKITKEELVEWAEFNLQEAEFEEEYFDQINEAISKIGLTDAKNFELLWEDYETILKSLGYNIHVIISKAG
jgi:ABC-type enterochelin transport system ATPase subunit